jgi:predicted acyl esterase
MPDGHGNECKTCVKVRHKQYYKTHKEDYDRRCKEWQAKNPDKAADSRKRQYKKNKDKHYEKKKQWAANNKEKVKEYALKFYKNHAEDLKQRVTKWRNENLEKTHEYSKTWRQNNPGKQNAKTARRRAMLLQATPRWLTEEHKKQIEAIYNEAARLTRETGIPHEVDHIMPLQGVECRGLHVPWNLQILTQKENAKKNNKILDNNNEICYNIKIQEE